MRSERGLQTVMGVVLAFSLLWVIAILIPDNDHGNTTMKSNYEYVDQTNRLVLPRKLKVVTNKKRVTSFQPQPSLETTVTKSSTNSTSKKKSPLFPTYAWFAAFIVYHARRFVKKRLVTYEDDFFIKSGLEAKLEYGMLEYEDDFLSVDNSFYGSMSNSWNGEELDKFDVSSQNSEELLDL